MIKQEYIMQTVLSKFVNIGTPPKFSLFSIP